MAKQYYAIATCRVSTDEQLQNNSLNRQKQAVLDAVEELDVIIPDDYWWSGSVSSKRGTNVERKDLNEMLECCKKDKRIKYLIVDEPDRFMRSIDEAAFFEVTFRQIGVTVWYASDPDLNKGDLSAKLLKFTKYLSAEGSNEERQNKSINGQTKALQDGRYTFHPKAGYRRGYEKGIHEIDEVKGPLLRESFMMIVERRSTPTQALKWLNGTEFMDGRSQILKMDRYRNIATDPYYPGAVWMDKQVKVFNKGGRHTPLITWKQHEELIEIMNNKKKNQKGPRKDGNPTYPLSNEVIHDVCAENSSHPRLVGVGQSNGKYPKVYEKYKCRACNKYVTTKDNLHDQVKALLRETKISHKGIEYMSEALDTVWKEKRAEASQESDRVKRKIVMLKTKVREQAEAAIDPSNASIKPEIIMSIEKNKAELVSLEESIESLALREDIDKSDFLEFAFSFIAMQSDRFFEESLSRENRRRCKQLLFPGGFYIDSDKKVYTPEISILYRLASNKKDLSETEKSSMVRVKRL